MSKHPTVTKPLCSFCRSGYVIQIFIDGRYTRELGRRCLCAINPIHERDFFKYCDEINIAIGDDYYFYIPEERKEYVLI